jgi:hypothetical protein
MDLPIDIALSSPRDQPGPQIVDASEVGVEGDELGTDVNSGGGDPDVVRRDGRAGAAERREQGAVTAGHLLVDRDDVDERLGQEVAQRARFSFGREPSTKPASSSPSVTVDRKTRSAATRISTTSRCPRRKCA